MRIDLSCPVELRQCELPREDYRVCEMTLFNLSEKEIASVQACFLCYNEEGELTSRSVERILAQDAKPREMFHLSTVVEEAITAAGLEVVFEKVFFGDGTVWRRQQGNETEFQPTPMLTEARLEVMHEIAGEDAITYPSDQGAVWICVCGRPNAAGEDLCRRCGREKHEVFISYNEAAVEKEIYERESRLEEEMRLEREKLREEARAQEERRRRRRRRVKIIVSVILSLIVSGVLAFGIIFHAIPYYKYSTAMRKMENRSWEDAKAIFAELDGNCRFALQDKDFQGLILECDYRVAKETYSEGNTTFESLEAAWQAFDKLSDIKANYPWVTEPNAYGDNGAYQDSAALALKARYDYAEKLIQMKNWEAAITAYERVPEYLDSADKILYARYQIAKEDMTTGKYREAYIAFTSDELKNYEDAASLATECRYLEAQQDMDSGEYLAAAEIYKELGSYKESELNLQKAYYGRGDQLYQQDAYTEAAEYFLMVSNYSDAYRRATQCLYDPAVKLMAEEKWEEAAERFEKIINYNDSRVKMQECYYALASACADAEDWSGAITWLDKIPEYDAGVLLRKKCIYSQAELALAAGNTEDATEMFILIGDYEDAAERANELLYDRGVRYMNEKNWEAAAEVFSQLTNYKDSEKELKSARYGTALNLIESGDYDTAIAILGDMKGYQKAEDYIQLAEYRKAQKLLESGEYVLAADAFEALGKYKDSVDQRKECLWQRAMQLTEESDLAGAVLLLKMIPDYKNAKTLINEYGYTAAKEKEAAGDMLGAALLYDEVEGYQDAKQRAEDCRDLYYASAYAEANAAYSAKQYDKTIEILEQLDLSAAGSQYADMTRMYNESCYLLANSLYEKGKIYEAYAYYIRIPDYKDVTEKKLNRTCYRILGVWESAKGQRLEFRADGTCTIEGREYYFNVPSQYALHTGDRAESLKLNYEIITSRDKELTLKILSSGGYYRLTRVTENAN